MSASDEKLAAALSALRSDYIADAPQRIAELWGEFARVQNGDARALVTLRTLAHRLAGSGGAYGLPVVSERARAADQFCRAAGSGPLPRHMVPELRQLLQGIADAFHDASYLE